MWVMRPRIALNASYLSRRDEGWEVAVKSAYGDAILGAGGAPFILPPVEERGTLRHLLAVADGVLLIGGGDISARRYGASQSRGAHLVHPRREAFDFALLAAALRARKAVLGICLGCQVLNVHYGGTLYQHLPEEPANSGVRHSRRVRATDIRHLVTVGAGTLLSRICGAGAMEVNSTHHQGIRALGRRLVASARAPDGLIEAIEDPGRAFVVGVQWHPEDLTDDARHRRLFEAFVEAAGSSSLGEGGINRKG